MFKYFINTLILSTLNTIFIYIEMDYLILGLGNPGTKYEHTRHNIGWMVAESFIKKHNASIQSTLIYNYSIIEYANKKIFVAMPTTYMNLSGEAAIKIKNKYSLSNDKIVVIVDEYNFQTGRIQLKKGGSDGGHNGISSIISELNSNEFYRLRCGIDNKFGPGELVDYVLGKFPTEEEEKLKLMMNKAVLSLEILIKDGVSKTMNNINNEAFWEKKLSLK